MMDVDGRALPSLLAGPVLRRATVDRVVLWLVASYELKPCVLLVPGDTGSQCGKAGFVACPTSTTTKGLQIGEEAWVYCLDIRLGDGTGFPQLPEGNPVGYEVLDRSPDGSLRPVGDPLSLAYPGEIRPRFVIHTRIGGLFHGSCRRPHDEADDGLVRADQWLAGKRDQPEMWPSLLVMTGDQIYADDVAGPMLRAIHGLIECLGLHGEAISGAEVRDAQALMNDSRTYYQRSELLPRIKPNIPLREILFGGVRKPVFTTANAGNHLITLAEVMAMYLLVWSDACWQLVTPLEPPDLDADQSALYDAENKVIQRFVQGLPKVRRLLAHLPTVMIFDDHDITDDWNMTAEWEQVAYGHPFSRRIIGNALIGYFIFQAWGNLPEVFEPEVLPLAETCFSNRDERCQDQLIDTLLGFEQWHFTLPTEPALVVMDNRTRRWRSGRNLGRPSGLLNWEALSELQQELLGRSAVILVSPTPIIGVKLVENVQRLFILAGKPLLVDAENWMAHGGAANTLLNIFQHKQTPHNFTILSGDVHYSFAYDLALRDGGKDGPRIWQLTSSGIKNEFPAQLLEWFDRLNRWLFAPYSPLNWLTRRRRLHIRPRKPDPSARGERLVNKAGMGYVRFDAGGRPVEVCQLGSDGIDVSFRRVPGRTGED